MRHSDLKPGERCVRCPDGIGASCDICDERDVDSSFCDEHELLNHMHVHVSQGEATTLLNTLMRLDSLHPGHVVSAMEQVAVFERVDRGLPVTQVLGIGMMRRAVEIAVREQAASDAQEKLNAK